MSAPVFQPVRSAAEIAAVAALARTIWTAHFTPLIGPEQVEYMLGKFQSEPAITDQLAHGYAYYLVRESGADVGYLALAPQPDGSVQLSKLYLRADVRGQGLGRAMVDFAAARARELGATVLWLTCNRHNGASLAFYDRVGFVVAATLVADIGNGFVMDDYRLELSLESGGSQT